MATEHAESYAQEFADEFDLWQSRIETLRHMATSPDLQSRREVEAVIGRIETTLKAVRDLIGRSDTMSAEEWMDIHPKVTAMLFALQSWYNNLMADWASSRTVFLMPYSEIGLPRRPGRGRCNRGRFG